MLRTLRPLLSKLFRNLSPVHKERDRLVASVAARFAENPVLRVPDFLGDFQIDPRSRLFVRLIVEGNYEPDLVRIVCKHLDPARDAIDVGANIGFFSCLLAKSLPGRRVLSVEPTLGALTLLRANLIRNEIETQVRIFEGVAADKRGVVSLAYVQGMEEFSSLGEITHPSANVSCVKSIDVASETIDNLVSQMGLEPGFIKVDTEGAEAMVFAGAQEVLRKFRPIVLSELSDPLLRAKGSSALKVIQNLEALDYVVTDPLSPTSRPGSRPYGDLLAIPRR